MNKKLFYNEFIKIRNLGWVKSLRSGTSGIGYTFETLLGKVEDNFSFPDFHGIEIKTKHHFSKGYMTLFNATPDGDFLFPLDYLRNKYGTFDNQISNVKIFQHSIQNKQSIYINNYNFSLLVSKKNKKVILQILDIYNNTIDNSISWSFEYLKGRLLTKLSYLAVIYADNNIIDNEEYLYYKHYDLYKLKDFDIFLNMIENGKIRITFKLGVFKSGKRNGQIHDHGTGFDIHINNIMELYEKI